MRGERGGFNSHYFFSYPHYNLSKNSFCSTYKTNLHTNSFSSLLFLVPFQATVTLLWASATASQGGTGREAGLVPDAGDEGWGRAMLANLLLCK